MWDVKFEYYQEVILTIQEMTPALSDETSRDCVPKTFINIVVDLSLMYYRSIYF